MNAQRYPEEFRVEAVKKILEHGYSMADLSLRLGVSTHSLAAANSYNAAARASKQKLFNATKHFAAVFWEARTNALPSL